MDNAIQNVGEYYAARRGFSNRPAIVYLAS